MSDIVERLRLHGENNIEPDDGDLELEAAAEIERLRAELARYVRAEIAEFARADSLYDDPPKTIDRSPMSWWRSG